MFDELRGRKQAKTSWILNQAQQEIAGQCYDALGELIQGVVTQNQEQETQAREALDKALQALGMATSLGERLREVPEAATSSMADKLKQPATDEAELQRQMLEELQTTDDVPAWYKANRTRLDQVQSPALRNHLFDTIRSRL
ncbi:MAG: hypothetical protein WC565_08260 [Parcubacteria group bacterium]